MNASFTKNSVFGIGVGWITVNLLHYAIPSYGKSFSVGNLIIDFGIYALSIGGFLLYSLN